MSEVRKIPFIAGGRNRERMLVSPYMTPFSIRPVTGRRALHSGFLLAVLVCCTQPAVAQGSRAPTLTPTEQKIRDYVRGHQAEQASFLEKAVNISSGTFNLPGVRAVGRLFEPEFTALGFSATWVALPAAVGRAGHLFAEHKGTRGKRLLLIGHLDTVFEGEGERFVRLDTLAAGAGSSDMKGGAIVFSTRSKRSRASALWTAPESSSL